MLQLSEDVSWILALLSFSIIGWTISKWTHGRFAASGRSREAELAKLQKIGADSDGLLAESKNGEHEAPRFPLVLSNLHDDVKEKSPHVGVQNRRRPRRRAKAAKLEADVRLVERELVMSSQSATSDTFASHLEQEHVSTVVVASTAKIEEQIDGFKTDLVVSVPEALVVPFPTKEVLSEERHRDEEVLSTREALRTQRTAGLSEETKLSQRSMGSYQAGEEMEKQDAPFQSGSSTHGDAQETVSSEDDTSTLSNSICASASLGSSEPAPSISMFPLCISNADSRCRKHGDGWMMSFDELQLTESRSELSNGTKTSLFGQQQMIEEDTCQIADKVSRSRVESAKQTPVAVVHSEHAFVIGGRMFVPFTDVHGQHLYTDGEIVYDATCVLANSSLTPGPSRSAEAIDGMSDVSRRIVEELDLEERAAWAGCWDFVSIERR
jgi:hypothetical protein